MFKLNNGNTIPKIGIGTYKITDQATVTKIIKEGYDLGYRHIDTAAMYENETLIGNAIKELKIDRSELFITTKIHYHYSPEVLKTKINEALERLQTGYIDLFLIHWPNNDHDLINSNTWKVFEEFYEKGIFKNIGVSNFTRYHLGKLIENAKVIPQVNQVEMTPALNQIPLKRYMDEYEIQMIAYAPFMRTKVFEEPFKEPLLKIGTKYNDVSVAEVVLAWGMARNIAVIPKTATTSRLKTNYNALNIHLKKQDIIAINNLNTGKRLFSDPSNNNYGKIIK